LTRDRGATRVAGQPRRFKGVLRRILPSTV